MHYHHYEANNDILGDDGVTHLGAGDLPPPDPLLPGPINSSGPRSGKSTLHHNRHVTNTIILYRKSISSSENSWKSAKFRWSYRCFTFNWHEAQGVTCLDYTQNGLWGIDTRRDTCWCLFLWPGDPPPVGDHLLLAMARVSAISAHLQPPSHPAPATPDQRISTIDKIQRWYLDISICQQPQHVNINAHSEYYICHRSMKMKGFICHKLNGNSMHDRLLLKIFWSDRLHGVILDWSTFSPACWREIRVTMAEHVNSRWC